MIFLSHNYRDKDVVEQFAIPLLNAFGQQSVFYDSWSIQPGEGIIDRMNTGLKEASIFLFFVSKDSLSSKMVELEWQNALMAKTKRPLRFVPIRLDQSPLPEILTQTVFLDLYTNGIDTTLRQIFDIAKGENIFRPVTSFSNLVAKKSRAHNTVTVEVEATRFLHPNCRFLYFTTSDPDNVQFEIIPPQVMYTNQLRDVEYQSRKYNIILVDKMQSLVTGFPFRVKFQPKNGMDVVDIDYVQRAWAWVLLLENNTIARGQTPFSYLTLTSGNFAGTIWLVGATTETNALACRSMPVRRWRSNLREWRSHCPTKETTYRRQQCHRCGSKAKAHIILRLLEWKSRHPKATAEKTGLSGLLVRTGAALK